jgi:hypothetical protein
MPASWRKPDFHHMDCNYSSWPGPAIRRRADKLTVTAAGQRGAKVSLRCCQGKTSFGQKGLFINSGCQAVLFD